MSLSPHAEAARQHLHDAIQVMRAVRHQANRAATLADLARAEAGDVALWRARMAPAPREAPDVARGR